MRPTSLSETLDLLAEKGGKEPAWTIAAGCTHVLARPALERLQDRVLDITGLDFCRSIEDRGDHLRISTLVTWQTLAELPSGGPLDTLREAALGMGTPQVRHVGTLGGNLCHASPAADGVPPLLALDAHVELSARGYVRKPPLSEFLVSPGRTARKPHELLTAILVPKPAGLARGTFLKLRWRRFRAIAVASVAVHLVTNDEAHIIHAAVAVGACGPMAIRLPALEAALQGTRVGDGHLAALVDNHHLIPLAPRDDVRASAAYRERAAATLVRRALGRLDRQP